MRDALVVAGLVFWILVPGNYVGWWFCCGSPKSPFNWRVFLGPWVYHKWLEER